MDEMTMLRSAGAETTHDPTPQALARGRAALLTHAGQHRCAGQEPADNPITLPDGIEGAESRSQAGPVTNLDSHRRRWRRWVWVPAAAAALTGTLVVGELARPPEPAATAVAAQVLEDAAVSSFGAEDPAVGAGQYLRVDTLARHLTTTAMPNHSFHTVKQMRHSLYIPADTDDTWYWDRTEKVDAEVVATYGQAPPTADPYPLRGAEEPPTPIWKAPGGAWNGQAPYVTKEYLASLPDDPHQLLARVHEEKAGQNANEDEQVMVFIADMLRSGLVTAEQRAVFYQTLMLVPGVDVTAETAVLDGRTGVAIGRWEATRGERQEIIIDPATGAWIGERSILTRDMDSIPAGTVVGSTAVSTTVVDKVPAQIRAQATEGVQ